MKNLRIILVISILLNLLTSIYVGKKIYVKYNKPVINKNKVGNKEVVKEKITYFIKRNELFETLPLDNHSIVFIGNSLTHNFEFTEFFQNLNIKNRGINGDIVEGVINRLDPIIKSKPHKIFIEIGINDFGRGASKDSVIKNYKKLIKIIKTKTPKTELYVQSIFPTENTSKEFPTYCNKEVNNNIIELNKELLSLSKIDDFTFIDTYNVFALNRQLDPKYSVDGVHLNGIGYRVWANILKPYVNE